MLPSVSSVESRLDTGAARGDSQSISVTIDQQIYEAERTLERLKRDLVAAQSRAQQQEQKLVEARRRMEQWRWVNAINEGDPEAARLAASLAAQTHVVDAVAKSSADVSARVDRLQNKIERQIARFFDLQSRRRAIGDAGRRDSATSPQESRSRAAPSVIPDAAEGVADKTPHDLAHPAPRFLTA